MNRPVVILGAGLAGLTAARDLRARGVDVVVLEARDEIGGRIRATRTDDGGVFDLGPTWFGDEHTALVELLEELGVDRFEQFVDRGGRVDLGMRGVFDLGQPKPDRPTWRVVGGTVRLIEALADTITKDAIRTRAPVSRIVAAGGHLRVDFGDESIEADRVISTLVPRVFLEHVVVEPRLDDDVRAGLAATPIWMGHVVKFWARYDHPFWRAHGGYGFAQTGIVGEVHDHTDAEESVFALTGFLHSGAHRLAFEERRARCLSQLGRLFGSAAESPIDYGDFSWPDDPTTSFPDADPVVPGTRFGDTRLQQATLDGRLLFAGTECEPVFGGYMEGAVRSGRRAATWASRA